MTDCAACNDVRLVDDGNGLSVPCDACEAATIAAMHAQTAPPLDCDDDPMTWAGPSYPAAPVMAAEVDALRARIAELEAQLDAATARAETAEAKLAQVGEYATYYVLAWELFEENSDGPEPLDFAEWLAAQGEVQP